MAGRELDQGRWAVLVPAGALVVGAIVLIVKIAGASHYDSQAASEAFLMALVLVFITPCAASGLHLAARRPQLAWFGYITAAVALIAFATVAARLFKGESFFFGDARLQGVALALTLATSQVSLVAAYDRDDDPLPVRLVSAGTVLAIVVLVGVGVYDVLANTDSPSAKFFGIVSTLYLLGAALLVLLHGSEWIRRRRVAGGAGAVAG